jgi:hypothetical protein
LHHLPERAILEQNNSCPKKPEKERMFPMKRAYTNGILLDGTEQMQPEAHKILLTEDDKIIAIVDEGVDLDELKAKRDKQLFEVFRLEICTEAICARA